jgi:hypothetical protein
MPTLAIDVLPEMPAPRGYIPAAAPLPPATEPILPLPATLGPGDVPSDAAGREALLGNILASAAAARGHMLWSDATRLALLGASIAEHAGADAWARRFAHEAAAIALLASTAPESLEEDGDRDGDGDRDTASPGRFRDDATMGGDSRTLVNRAIAAALAGDADAASDLLAAAEDAIAPGDELARLLVLANRAQLLLDAGDLSAASRVAADALRLARREKQDYWAALAGIPVSLAHLARGRRNAARAQLGDAARLFARYGDALRQVQCHYLLGEVAWSGEDPIRAGTHYRDALAIARPAGAQAWIELLTLRFEHR